MLFDPQSHILFQGLQFTRFVDFACLLGAFWHAVYPSESFGGCGFVSFGLTFASRSSPFKGTALCSRWVHFAARMEKRAEKCLTPTFKHLPQSIVHSPFKGSDAPSHGKVKRL